MFVGSDLRIYNEAPLEANPHRCDEMCGAGCDYCGEQFCFFDWESFKAVRIGDSEKHIFICTECSESEAA